MQRPGNEPTRRNRNQGTKKRGRGQDNRLIIPERFTRRLELVRFWEQLAYWQRPTVEREQFAHRYADTLCARWKKLGLVPFPRRQSRRRLEEMGLTAAEFGLEESEFDRG